MIYFPYKFLLAQSTLRLELDTVAVTPRPFNPVPLPRPFLLAHALNAAGSRE
jgi:hypothetical protein